MQRAIIVLAGCLFSAMGLTQAPDTGTPRVFLVDADRLVDVRARIAAGDPALEPAFTKLLRDADGAMVEGPFTVVHKSMNPPSGDRHDYMSVGPYWWPNPDTEDGLPYVRRDGETNPERHDYDNVGLSNMSGAVRTLALAYFLTGKETYAERATTLLRVWFLDPTTRMNPNLNFGQAIPGRVEGRGVGIIDTMGLPLVVDAVGMLQSSEAWTQSDQERLQQWFSEYLDWMLNHRYGKDERGAHNNHGTWYDVQAVSFALFAGRDELAREILETVPENRIAKHFDPDGSQPHELARTKSFGYSCMNLTGFFYLAALGERFDLDLWRYETKDGSGMREGLDWIVEHAYGEGEWQHQNVSPITPDRLLPLLRMAAIAYEEPAYEQKLHELAGDDWVADRVNLLWSAPKS